MRRSLSALFEAYRDGPSQVDVLVTDNEGIRRLNQIHRGVDEATDVLSFPGPDWPGAPLGDIAVSVDFAAKGAQARQVSLEDELALLAVHGGLHLLGFDDGTEDERADMVARMNSVMESVGLPTEPDWASQPHGEG